MISSDHTIITATRKVCQNIEKYGISIIGRITEKGRHIIKNDKIMPLNPPDTDELLKIQ